MYENKINKNVLPIHSLHFYFSLAFSSFLAFFFFGIICTDNVLFLYFLHRTNLMPFNIFMSYYRWKRENFSYFYEQFLSLFFHSSFVSSSSFFVCFFLRIFVSFFPFLLHYISLSGKLYRVKGKLEIVQIRNGNIKYRKKVWYSPTCEPDF